MSTVTTTRKEERIEQAMQELQQASTVMKEQKIQKLLSAVDALASDEQGLELLYKKVGRLMAMGIFKNTVWEHPERLVPSLVGGTLKSGFPTSVLETLSELRLLHLATSKETDSGQRAHMLHLLKQVIVKNLNLLYPESNEETREAKTSDANKLEQLFLFLISHIPPEEIKISLAKEIAVLSAQRRIVIDRLIRMLTLVDEKIPLIPGNSADDQLQFYLSAYRAPSPGAKKNPTIEAYTRFLELASPEMLQTEAEMHGENMAATGIVANSHVLLTRFLDIHHPDLIPKCLALSGYGLVEWETHRPFIGTLIESGITLDFPQSVYGLHQFLGRSLLARNPVRNALTRLLKIEPHDKVKALLRFKREGMHGSEQSLLVAGVICVLGSPLGIGQGNNPTCQSARGISMWSQHSPAKLLQLIIMCSKLNTLDCKYEGEVFESRTVGLGLAKDIDLNLDPVSIVLVPHLDKLYNAMMKRAALKHPFEDPHSSVNPAFYGSFIQNGFLTVYDNVAHAIKDYGMAVSIFYHSYHPEYNGENPVVYPVPLGIFITTSSGEMLGFHAISLLRVARDPSEEWRIYFLNPNDEGRQNWGQGIEPSVHGNGERAGESSLPFHELVSRVYAFHYNELTINSNPYELPHEVIERVEKLARESWGRKYNWI